MGDIIHRLFLAQPPPTGVTHPCLHVQFWLAPPQLPLRPGLPPNESWGSRAVVFKITSVCSLADKSCQSGAGLYLGLSPAPAPPAPWPADSLSEQGVGARGKALCCLTPPALASKVPVLLPHWLRRAGLEHCLTPPPHSYSAAPSPPVVPWPLRGLCPPDWAALSGGRVAFPRDSLLPIKLFAVGELPPPPPPRSQHLA